MGWYKPPKWLRRLLDEKMEKQNVELGRRLKKARLDAGWSEWNAAIRMGRDQSFISRIEAGSRQPTFAEVEQLARNYHKPLSEFETILEIEDEDSDRYNIFKLRWNQAGPLHERPWKYKKNVRSAKATRSQNPRSRKSHPG